MYLCTSPTEKALEARARRAAIRNGYAAIKSRCRRDSWDNCGGFQLIDPSSNIVVKGSRYDMSADDVLDFFRSDGGGSIARGVAESA